jgi:hypothetical protein
MAPGCPVQVGFGSRGGERYASERIGLREETQMSQSNSDPSTTEAGNRFQQDRMTRAARPMKPLMDSMLRPKRYDVPPKIRLLVPRRIMLKQSRL